MSPASLRRDRVRLYAYSNTGADGIPNETYTFIAEWWGRLAALGAKQFTVGEQGEHTVNAIVELSDEVTVDRNGALTVGADVYLIRGVLPRPTARAVEVLCEFCDKAQPTLVDP